MRVATCLALLLARLASQAFTAASQAKTILFRQSGQVSPSPANGHQVSRHEAWASGNVAALRLRHVPVAGHLALGQNRAIQMDMNLRVNPFAPRALLTGSERLKRSARLKAGEPTDPNHPNLGMLPRVTSL
ncbi:hypothetical protein [Pseudomonas sp. RIT-PI-AD]|uniref:hypothetical protein n=1 Tax=Pseudomonas sp. RIT-PI-AD TaxID=3035294 RepID=UPI0021D8580C|nr:hypothetical protein [Pseudomonas sp. RIT-PI-AD]